jgi:hypothetical protein
MVTCWRGVLWELKRQDIRFDQKFGVGDHPM